MELFSTAEIFVQKLTILGREIKTNLGLLNNLPAFYLRMVKLGFADPFNGLAQFFSVRLGNFFGHG